VSPPACQRVLAAAQRGLPWRGEQRPKEHNNNHTTQSTIARPSASGRQGGRHRGSEQHQSGADGHTTWHCDRGGREPRCLPIVNMLAVHSTSYVPHAELMHAAARAEGRSGRASISRATTDRCTARISARSVSVSVCKSLVRPSNGMAGEVSHTHQAIGPRPRGNREHFPKSTWGRHARSITSTRSNEC
jgi:hypothetical protein